MTPAQLGWHPQKQPGGCLPAAGLLATAAFCCCWVHPCSLCCPFTLFFGLFVTAQVPGSIPLELREQLYWLL